MLRLRKISMNLAALMMALAVLWPVFMAAQDDPNETPLGDVARDLRKKNPPSQDVIDNDNLTQVMDSAESSRPTRFSFLYSILGGGKKFQVSAPDVTCSLSFSGNAKSLISSQYVQLDLPADQFAKLEGPAAAIEGDTLAVSVFNGTDWHVSEVAVALTIVKHADGLDMSTYFAPGRLLPEATDDPAQEPASNSGRRSDVTVLYRIRAAAPPLATTVFRTPLNLEIAPDQEWHWAIVQAKGYPPQHSSESATQASAQPVTGPASLPAPGIPQSASATAPLQISQDSPVR